MSVCVCMCVSVCECVSECVCVYSYCDLLIRYGHIFNVKQSI